MFGQTAATLAHFLDILTSVVISALNFKMLSQCFDTVF